MGYSPGAGWVREICMEKVTTKEGLETAIQSKECDIEVSGELAKRLSLSRKVKKVGAWGLAALGAGVIAAPFTAGASLPIGFAAITTETGIAVSLIAGTLFLGAGFLYAIRKEYEVIEYSPGPPVMLRLRRRRS